MLTSILHRVSGDGMALVGLGVLVWWLGALASGPAAYETFLSVMWGEATFELSFWGIIDWLLVLIPKIVIVGLTWAFFTHLMSGLRHFVLDIGAGYELNSNRMWSIASPIIAILLTSALWSYILLR